MTKVAFTKHIIKVEFLEMFYVNGLNQIHRNSSANKSILQMEENTSKFRTYVHTSHVIIIIMMNANYQMNMYVEIIFNYRRLLG